MDNILKVASDLGLEILPATETHINRMSIKSTSGDGFHTISQLKSTNEWQCSCKAWTNKKPNKPRGCKHLDLVIKHLAQVSSETISAPVNSANNENSDLAVALRVLAQSKLAKIG